MADADSNLPVKLCLTCGTHKLRPEFSKFKSQPDGLNHTCRQCRRAAYLRRIAAVRAYYIKTKSAHLQRAAERRTRVGKTPKHIEGERARRLRWRERNIDHVMRAEATRRIACDDVFKAKVRRNGCNARARRRRAFVEHIDPMVVFNRDGWMCGICHTPVARCEVSLDHVLPLARGGLHEYANVQCAHLFCNLKKGASLPKQFVR